MLRTLPQRTARFRPSPRLLNNQISTFRLQQRNLHVHCSVAPIIRTHHAKARPQHPPGVRRFHSTPRNQAPPLVAILTGLLKTSITLEYVRMAARVALSFAPMLWVRGHFTRKYVRHLTKDKPEMTEKKEALLTKIRRETRVFWVLMSFPVVLLVLTMVASLERAPISGRWRMILLSPEEEEEIAQQLAGTGWYRAVGEILAQDGPITIVPSTDWKYQWVLSTLRKLESIIPVLAAEHSSEKAWFEQGPDDIPLPPPADYPLRPRPNAKEMLRWFCEMSSARIMHPTPHKIPGPPYSLVVVDRPDCENAFSFGFGPDGGGGIVVYSGFLDRILAMYPSNEPSPPPANTSYIASLFGGLFRPTPPRESTYEPTPEQTSHLAILLAHELAHLILSHHIETLSAASVIVPGTLSVFTDLIRVVLFPVTMFFGPFLNDALAGLGKASIGETTKLHEYCTSMKQELEADVVSTRILAHAGFDAREAIRFWETRTDSAECTPGFSTQNPGQPKNGLPRNIMGNTHPIHSARIQNLSEELQRWDSERKSVLRELYTVGHRALIGETVLRSGPCF